MIKFIANIFKKDKNPLINMAVLHTTSTIPSQISSDAPFISESISKKGIIVDVKKNGNLLVKVAGQVGEYAIIDPKKDYYKNINNPNEIVLVY